MLKSCNHCKNIIDVIFNENGKAVVECPFCETNQLFYGPPSPKKEVIFYDTYGFPFCCAQDFETASFMWGNKLFTMEVDGVRYPANDWKGRQAIEKLFDKLVLLEPQYKDFI